MIILTHEILEIVTDNNAFIVLVKSISKRANYKDQSCFPSHATMQTDTGFSKNTVIRACKWLQENGIIQIVKRKNKEGGDTSNFYTIDTDLIRIIGKLKLETPVQNLNTPDSNFEHPPVQNLNTNHKSNLTTSPINSSKENIKEKSIKLSTEEKIKIWEDFYFSDEELQKFAKDNLNYGVYKSKTEPILFEISQLRYVLEECKNYYSKTMDKSKTGAINPKSSFAKWLSKTKIYPMGYTINKKPPDKNNDFSKIQVTSV